MKSNLARKLPASLMASAAHSTALPIRGKLLKVGRVRMDATAGLVEIQSAIKDLLQNIKVRDAEMDKALKKADDEIKAFGKISDEVKNQLAALATAGTEVNTRLLAMEQKIVALKPANDDHTPKTPGYLFVNNDAIKPKLSEGRPYRGKLFCPMNTITSLTSGDGGAGDLIVPQRIGGIIEQRFRRLRIRDLLPVGRTVSNSLEFVQESGFTNNAAPVAEGATKPESSLSFELATAPVRTIAHVMKASVQILQDVPQLQSFIDTRLRIGLAIEEEDQLLSGDGTGQNLYGLIPQATAYDTARTQVGDTRIDIIRRSVTQIRLAEYEATAVVLHPTDWEIIELTKATDGQYIWANPRGLVAPTIWGLPVVTSTALTEGEFLIGAFDVAAQIWDRQLASVEVSTEDEDNFRRNLVTVRAEERIALTVYRPESFVYGDFDSIVSS